MTVNWLFCNITLQYSVSSYHLTLNLRVNCFFQGFGVCDVMLRERNKSFPDTSIPVGKERHSIILPVNDVYYTLIQTHNEVELKLNFSEHFAVFFSLLNPYCVFTAENT